MSLRKPKTPVASKLTSYPIGSFIETELGYFYILSDTKRLRFLSKRVLDSWKPPRVILTSEKAVAKYKISSKMKFRNGTLIHNISDGRIFLIEESKKRHITNPDVLTNIGASLKDVVTVSIDEYNLHETGENLN